MKKLFTVVFIFLNFIKLAGQTKIVVAQDGSGNFSTVQQALNKVPMNNSRPFIIYIKKGIYKEKLHLDSSKKFVTIIGEDKFSTILTYDDHSGRISPKGDTINTSTSASFVEAASDFNARNITFQNDAGPSAGQAVAIKIAGDRSQFHNCRFIGDQDVLFSSKPNTRQYFEHCYIEGTTDFIFGPSTAWFEQCHIHSKKNSHVTAASTPKETAIGYVFYDCVLTADTALYKVSLGRPWRPYASVTYIHCYLDRHIMPQGWANWNQTNNYKTTRYSEYKNYGPGSGTINRVNWSYQLTDEQAKKFTLKNVMKNWHPETNKL